MTIMPHYDITQLPSALLVLAVIICSMNRKIPHALDEHEGNTLGFAEVLIPGTRQQVVNKGGHVADVHAAVLVAIGGCQINA